jgi:predicted metal-dependent hydrolase
MTADREKDAAISQIKQEYADKLQVRLEVEVKNMKDMYAQILNRLPDVNVRLKGEV